MRREEISSHLVHWQAVRSRCLEYTRRLLDVGLIGNHSQLRLMWYRCQNDTIIPHYSGNLWELYVRRM